VRSEQHKKSWSRIGQRGQSTCGRYTGAATCARHGSKKSSIVIHCSDGWDQRFKLRQLTKPRRTHPRTKAGFGVLNLGVGILKISIHGSGHTPGFNTFWTSDETSPVFVQFLTRSGKCSVSRICIHGRISDSNPVDAFYSTSGRLKLNSIERDACWDRSTSIWSACQNEHLESILRRCH
jgi:hypothetical protein